MKGACLGTSLGGQQVSQPLPAPTSQRSLADEMALRQGHQGRLEFDYLRGAVLGADLGLSDMRDGPQGARTVGE